MSLNGAAEYFSRIVAISFTIFCLKLLWGDEVHDMLLGVVALAEWNFYDLKLELRKIEAGRA